MNSLPRFSDGARDLPRLIVSRAHDPERNPLRRARSNSRHLSQLRNQIPDCLRIFRLFQNTRRSILGAFPSTAEQAAPAGANRIAAEDRLRPPSPAPSETRYTLLPNVSLDTEPLRSRKNLDARYAPAWLRLPAKVVRRFHVDPANLSRSQNQSAARRLRYSPDRKCAYQSECLIHRGDFQHRTCAPVRLVRRWLRGPNSYHLSVERQGWCQS